MNVFIFLIEFFCIKLAIKLESIPPDKKHPTSTSAIIIFFTDFSNKSFISDKFFLYEKSISIFLFLTTDQYFSFLITPFEIFIISEGNTLKTFLYMVRGAGIYPNIE